MSMYVLLRNNQIPEKWEIDEALQGNLCRCTGYRPILESCYEFAKDSSAENCFTGACCGNPEKCCTTTSNTQGSQRCCNTGGTFTDTKEQRNVFVEDEGKPFDTTQDLVFPSELTLSRYDLQYLKIEHEACKWFSPCTLKQIFELRQRYPDAKLIAGGTDVVVEMKFKNYNCPILISTTGVAEFQQLKLNEYGIFVGASVSMSDLIQYLNNLLKELPIEKTRIFRAVLEMMKRIGSQQIRNVATVAGSVVTSHTTSDLNPLFMASNSLAIVESINKGRREILIDETFFRKTSWQEFEDVLVGIKIPFSVESEHFSAFKQAPRRDNARAIVNAGMRVLFQSRTNIVKGISLCYGGVAATVIGLRNAKKSFVGRQWNEKLLEDVTGTLIPENFLKFTSGETETKADKFQLLLCQSFFYKFFTNVATELQKQGLGVVGFDSRLGSIMEDNCSPLSSQQIYPNVPDCQKIYDAVGRPETHLSAEKHTTGEAAYCDDVEIANALYGCFVLSTRAHAKIVSIDVTEALRIKGVVNYVDYKDIPRSGVNYFGAEEDEEIFVEKEVTAFGRIIGMVVAETADIARRACQLVKVEYEDLPVVFTIEKAIESNSFYGGSYEIKHGEPYKMLLDDGHIIEGQVQIGGQHHFYMETQSCIAIPMEGQELEIISSTQHACELQMQLSKSLGLAANKIVVKVKRLGGGFGGKEIGSVRVALPCAVAALKLRKPVRCCVQRFDDMVITGYRHPYLGKYKISCDKDGKFIGYSADLYGNTGYSKDLAKGALTSVMLHAPNAYSIPNLHITGKVCKTNISSSTACRGFGRPQAVFMIEHCITDLAYSMGVFPETLRENNLCKEGDETFYHLKLDRCNIRRCWNECMEMSDFPKRRRGVDEFNKNSRWKKRGIAVIPLQYGVGFNSKHLNQAGALVHIYRDGSVLISHGGIEMGQGLHSKMAQVATRTLGIPLDMIYINDTATDKVANASVTAASTGSDLNGGAVQNACEILLQRLKPVMQQNLEKSWPEIIEIAYKSQINLSANGFYKLDGMDDYNFDTQMGKPFGYMSYSAACTEVEIDCLTGDHRILRTDIVMDVGESLNPAIDIGQIEGGFIQGYGLFTMEEVKYSADGILYSRGPGTYKIPSAGDIPKRFNVKLLEGSSNPHAVFSSKAIGEPPLILGASVFFALKDAIKSAREENGLSGPFRLDSPATVERIRLACGDNFM